VARLVARAAEQGRADDTAEVISRRLEVFGEATRPVLDFYRERGILHVIDAAADLDTVTAEIVAALPPLVRARESST
jgi:adenylate kinase